MIVQPTPAKISLPHSPIAPRSRGIHASGLIRSIAARTGILKPEWVDDPDYIGDEREITDPTAILRILIGLAWEEYYLNHILIREGVVKHPGEMSLDGIHMTPDGESVDVIITPSGKGVEVEKTALVIHEVKATYKSLRTTAEFDKQWLWLTQAKAYCKGAGTRYAKFHVLHLCGDYKMPLKPAAQCWNIEFTQKELDDNWDLLRDYKKYQENR